MLVVCTKRYCYRLFRSVAKGKQVATDLIHFQATTNSKPMTKHGRKTALIRTCPANDKGQCHIPDVPLLVLGSVADLDDFVSCGLAISNI